MSDFVVSARKYRPARFDAVVGQAHVSETLKNALRQNRLAHAFLFCGPRGVGKTTNARILAKVLNCLDVSADFEPCNACANCRAFNQNASFNIFELDAASNNKVDQMHQLMEQVRIPPQAGRKKVYIIDEVHMLSQAAFNAFLKTLEEPPDYAIFILATTEKHKILPTILSRCQVYDFHRIRPADMVAHLQRICAEEHIDAAEEALHLVAEKADGALRDALSIFDRLVSSAPASAAAEGAPVTLTYEHAATQLNVLDHATFFAVTDALLAEDVHTLYLLLDEVLANGFEPEPFLGGLARHLRQLFVCKSPQTLKLLEVSEQLRARYAEQARYCTPAFLVNALNLAAECDFRLRLATHKRLHVELYLVKMAYAARTVARDTVSVPAGDGGAAVAKTAGAATAPTKDQRAPAAATAPAPAVTSAPAPAPGASSAPAQETTASTAPEARTSDPATSLRDAGGSATGDNSAGVGGSRERQAGPNAADQRDPHGGSDRDEASDDDDSPSSPPPPPPPAPAQDRTRAAAETSVRSSTAQGPGAAPAPKRASALPSIDFDDDDGPVALAQVSPATLALPRLETEWLRLADEQPQRIKAVMRNARLSYESPTFTVRVGSLLALNILRTEANSIRDIKTTLCCDDLDIVYVFDESLAPKEEPKAKPNGPREQYQILMQANPEVDSLRKRLDLDFTG